MHPLVKAIPDYALLLELEPEELAAKLLFAGPGDTLNNFLIGLWPERQSIIMCDALNKVGGTCGIVSIEAGGHGTGGWEDADQQHYKPEMIAWLKKTLNLN